MLFRIRKGRVGRNLWVAEYCSLVAVMWTCSTSSAVGSVSPHVGGGDSIVRRKQGKVISKASVESLALARHLLFTQIYDRLSDAELEKVYNLAVEEGPSPIFFSPGDATVCIFIASDHGSKSVANKTMTAYVIVNRKPQKRWQIKVMSSSRPLNPRFKGGLATYLRYWNLVPRTPIDPMGARILSANEPVAMYQILDGGLRTCFLKPDGLMLYHEIELGSLGISVPKFLKEHGFPISNLEEKYIGARHVRIRPVR